MMVAVPVEPRLIPTFVGKTGTYIGETGTYIGKMGTYIGKTRRYWDVKSISVYTKLKIKLIVLWN